LPSILGWYGRQGSTATRYSRRELLRLLAVMRGRKHTEATLAEMKQKLDASDDAAIEAWISKGPLPPAAAAALGITPETPAANHVTSPLDPALERFRMQLETCQRVQLLPGLELMLGANLSPAALSAAAKICAEYLG